MYISKPIVSFVKTYATQNKLSCLYANWANRIMGIFCNEKSSQ